MLKPFLGFFKARKVNNDFLASEEARYLETQQKLAEARLQLQITELTESITTNLRSLQNKIKVKKIDIPEIETTPGKRSRLAGNRG